MEVKAAAPSLTSKPFHLAPSAAGAGLAELISSPRTLPAQEENTNLSEAIDIVRRSTDLLIRSRGAFIPDVERIQRLVEKALPSRVAVRSAESPFYVAEVRGLFEWYHKFSLQLKAKYSAAEWRAFCEKTGQLLFKKGYYRKEAWLTGSNLRKTELKLEKLHVKFQEAALLRRMEKKTELQEYQRQIAAKIKGYLVAGPVLNSGLVATNSTTRDASVSIAATSVISIAASLPILGGFLHGGASAAQAIYNVSSERNKQINAAKISRWYLSDYAALTETLSLRLTAFREELLTSPYASDDSFLDWTLSAYTEFQQGSTLTPAQCLALKDAEIVYSLLCELEPQGTSLNEKENAAQNADAFLKEFAKKVTPGKKDEKKDASPVESKDSPTSSPEMGFLVNAEWYWQELAPEQRSALPHLQSATGIQILADEKSRLLEKWNKFLTQATPFKKPDRKSEVVSSGITLQELLIWQLEVNQTLRFPLEWEKEEITPLCTKCQEMWASIGIEILTAEVEKAQLLPWANWQTHYTQIAEVIHGLAEHAQTSTAQLIYDQYDSLLLNWAENIRKKSMHSKQESKRILKQYQDWSAVLKEWQEKLEPASPDPKLVSTLSGQVGLEYAKPITFQRLAKEAMQSGDFEPLRAHYANLMLVRNATRLKLGQDPTITAETIKALNGALQISIEAAEATFRTTQEELCQSHDTQAIALDKETESIVAAKQSLKILWQAPSTLYRRIKFPKKEKPPKKDQKVAVNSRSEFASGGEKPSAAKDFWKEMNLLIRNLETEMGPATCSFSIVAWNTEYPGILRGNWRWGILLENPATHNNEYWHVFMCLLDTRLSDLPVPEGMHWPGIRFYEDTQDCTNIITEENTIPFQENARELASSQIENPTAANLFDIYKQKSRTKLALETEGVTQSRRLSHTELQKFYALLLDEVPQEEDVTFYQPDVLLRPLLTWCQQIGAYYNLLPDEPSRILDLLKSQYLHPAFVEDIRAALQFSDSLRPPISAGEKPEFKRHYQHTLRVLKHAASAWSLTATPAANFDPMEYWLWEKLLASTSSFEVEAQDFLEQERRVKAVQTIIEVIIHRGWHTDYDRMLRYFKKLTAATRIIFLEQLTPHLLQKDLPLIERLRHAPLNSSGERFCHEEQQIEWQQRKLPLLWKDEKKFASTTPTLSKPSSVVSSLFDFPGEPVSIPKISVARFNEGLMQWVVEEHVLNPAIAEQIFLPDGSFRQKDPLLSGSHLVFIVTIEGKKFAIKFKPQQPSNDYMVGQLALLLDSQCMPMMELVKFHHGHTTTAALITEVVEGESLDVVMTKKPALLDKLQFKRFVDVFILELITNPEDSKPEHFFLVPHQDGSLYIMCIDKDRSFFQATRTQNGMMWSSDTLQVKTALYCLEQMRRPWKNEAADFLALDAFAVVREILTRAKKMHAAWKVLFTQTEVEQHYDQPETDRSFPLMNVPEELALLMSSRIVGLQTSIVAMSQPPFDQYTLNGLTILELTQPKLAKFYVPSHPPLQPSELKGEVVQDHRRVYPRFQQVVGCLYQVDAQKRHVSYLSRSLAMRSSVRIETPITRPLLSDIREGKACSPDQELQALGKLSERRSQSLLEVHTAFSELQSTAVVHFQALPLGHKIFLFRHFKQEAKSNPKLSSQKALLLQSMIGGRWLKLDLHYFDDQLVTDEVLEMILEEAGGIVEDINISGCTHLTPSILAKIERYCPNLKRLQMNDLLWDTVHIGNFSHLEKVEMNNARLLKKITFGTLPQLKDLSLQRASLLEVIGDTGFGILAGTRAWNLPKLQRLNTAHCTRLRAVHLDVEIPESLQWVFQGCDAIHIPSIYFSWMEGPPDLIETTLNSVRNHAYDGVRHEWGIYGEQSEEYIKSFARWLKTKPSLNAITISQFKELNVGAFQALAEAFKSNPLVLKFDMRKNSHGNDAAIAIGDALKINHELVFLDFYDAGVRDEGAQALLDGLPGNFTVTSIDLRKNSIDSAITTSIERLTARNRALLEQLYEAIATAQADKVAVLLAQGVSVNHIKTGGKFAYYTPLTIAAKNGDIMTFLQVLSATEDSILQNAMCDELYIDYRCRKKEDKSFYGKTAIEMAILLFNKNPTDPKNFKFKIHKLVEAYQKRHLPLPKIAEQWLKKQHEPPQSEVTDVSLEYTQGKKPEHKSLLALASQASPALVSHVPNGRMTVYQSNSASLPPAPLISREKTECSSSSKSSTIDSSSHSSVALEIPKFVIVDMSSLPDLTASSRPSSQHHFDFFGETEDSTCDDISHSTSKFELKFKPNEQKVNISYFLSTPHSQFSHALMHDTLHDFSDQFERDEVSEESVSIGVRETKQSKGREMAVQPFVHQPADAFSDLPAPKHAKQKRDNPNNRSTSLSSAASHPLASPTVHSTFFIAPSSISNPSAAKDASLAPVLSSEEVNKKLQSIEELIDIIYPPKGELNSEERRILLLELASYRSRIETPNAIDCAAIIALEQRLQLLRPAPPVPVASLSCNSSSSS